MPGLLHWTLGGIGHGVLNGAVDHLQDCVVSEQYICRGENRGQDVHSLAEPASRAIILASLQVHASFIVHQRAPSRARPAAVPANSSGVAVTNARILDPP